jgi:parallel beta-helix repeat protein
MRVPALAAVLLLMSGVALYGQQADLRARLETKAVPRAGFGLTFSLVVENAGPDTADSVVATINIPTTRNISYDPRQCAWEAPVLRCSTSRLEQGERATFYAGVFIPNTTLTITASVTSLAANDPQPSNNEAILELVPEFPAMLTAALSLKPPPMSGRSTSAFLNVTNEGSDFAFDVHARWTFEGDIQSLSSPYWSCRANGPRTLDCDLSSLRARESRLVEVVILSGAADTPLRSTVTVTASNAPPLPVTATYEAKIAGVADLHVTASAPASLTDDGAIAYRFTIANASSFTATRVQGRFRFAQGTRFAGAHDAECRETDTTNETIVCTMKDVGPNESRQLTIDVRPPKPQGRFDSFTTITWDDPIFGLQSQGGVLATIYRDYAVTTTADDMTGSLRAAMQNANMECVDWDTPCRIVFHLPAPVPTQGWFTIAPAWPLPALTTTDLVIDGATQTAFTGDTNQAGPEIEIRGSAASGDGFVIRAGRATITDLAINGFPDNGILVARTERTYPSVTLSGNFIGIDPTGELAIPNRRGIFFDGGTGVVTDNVIRGNARSGVFLASGGSLLILRNRIGSNGASGVYISPSAYGISIEKNEIANNGEFGIAINYTRGCTATENSIHDNGIDAIDIGLDGPTPNGPLVSRTPRPIVTVARYDAATGETVISVHIDGPPSSNVTAHVYANRALNARGYAEAERYLGKVRGGELRIAEDLRGQIITALSEIEIYHDDSYSRETSELSEGVVVQ